MFVTIIIHSYTLKPQCYVTAHTYCVIQPIQGVPGVRGNVPDFGRMFLTLKYTDITKNTYVYPKLNGYGDDGERSLKV